MDAERTGQTALGLAAFEALRAENEPWLRDCFVFPANFDQISGERSMAIYSRSGLGKSALCAMLAQYARENQVLPVRWQLVPSTLGSLEPFQPAQIEQILDACASAVLEQLVFCPGMWSEAPRWVRRMLGWFIHTYVQGDLSIRIGHLSEGDQDVPAGSVLQEIVALPPEKALFPPHNVRLILTELSKALQRMGIQGTWILVDPEEPTAENRAALIQAVHDFFSTLPLFDEDRFAYKWFLPAWSENEVLGASGFERRRLERLSLSWTPAELRQIVERRLAVATAGEITHLEQLCAAPAFWDWLEKVGGDCPWEWLNQTRPLLKHYLGHLPRAAVSEETWRELRQDYPPRLSLDEASRGIFVGGRQVPAEQVPPQSYLFFKYLYGNPNRIVSKAELYYRVYLGAETIPRGPADEGYEGSAEYAGIVDTALWRLRQAIEPDPEDPVLLKTVRGHGVFLERRW